MNPTFNGQNQIVWSGNYCCLSIRVASVDENKNSYRNITMKCNFFQAAVVSILLCGCTTWTLNKHIEKKLDGNYTKMLWVILNKSWRQHPTKQQLYGHLPPIMKTNEVRWTRHAGHCWRSRDKLISDVLPWIASCGRAKAGRPVRTYIQQHCADMGCSSEDLPGAMDDREGWLESVRDIRADGTTWWWWWFFSDKTWSKWRVPFLEFLSILKCTWFLKLLLNIYIYIYIYISLGKKNQRLVNSWL